MKCSIHVTGGISSVRHLVNAIEVTTYDSTGVREGMFNSYYIDFRKKKDAYKALWKGYKNLRADEPRTHGARYAPKHSLSYDAGRAVIVTD